MLRTLATAPLLVLAACIVAPAEPGDAPANALSDAEERAGFELLFDGESTGAWRGFARADFPDEGWEVVNGSLTRVGPGGDLVTREVYDDFELRLAWRIAPGGNSGVMWHVDEAADAGAPYRTGPEMQILDDAAHPGVPPEHSAGACYDLYAPSEPAARPAGAWNDVRLVVHEGRVEQWLNGVRVCAFDMRSEDWERRVAESKFGAMPAFAESGEGRVALQDHGDRVAFRALRIRRL